MSLKTATSINIIKANPENALKYNATFIQLKINAKEPNILTINSFIIELIYHIYCNIWSHC